MKKLSKTGADTEEKREHFDWEAEVSDLEGEFIVSPLPDGLCDEVTGLPNALLFQDRFQTAVHRVGRLGFGFGLGLLHLDGLVNWASKGPSPKIDQLICSVTELVSKKIRRSDTLARIETLKLALIFENVSEEKVFQRLAGKCLDAISGPIPFQKADGSMDAIQVNACMGLCLFPHKITDFEKVLPACETALTVARENGGGWQMY